MHLSSARCGASALCPGRRRASALCLTCAALLLSAAAAAPRARQEAAPQPQQPIFRASVDRVVVDVIVIDKRGRPVSDLTADDFMITVDGRPRRIASATFINATRKTAPLPASRGPYSSNEGEGGGRQIMIIVDQGNISKLGARRPLEAAGRFIDGLSAADRVGLHVLPGAGPHIDFTANHQLVKASLPQVVGESDPVQGFHHIGIAEAFAIDRGDTFTMQQVVERECGGMSGGALFQCQESIPAEARMVIAQTRERTQSSLFALRALLDRLAASAGPKTLLLVSEGLVVDRDLSDLDWIAERASAAQVSLYVLKLDRNEFDASLSRVSPTWIEDRELRVRGLETLAGMARGAVFPAAADPASAFARLSLELSGYYLLSFEPEPADRDSKRHTIKVESRRREITIRARREFKVDPGRSSMTAEQQLAEALKSPLVSADVPMRATTYTLLDPASSKLKVIVAAAIDPSRHGTGDLSLAFILMDTRGRLAATRVDKPLKAPVLGTLPEGWQSYVAAALVEPGAYTLKVAVLTPDGTTGSVEHTFRAALGSFGQLKFGDLMIAEPRRADAPTARPVATPAVGSESVVTYLELYSEAPDQLERSRVRFEVAQSETATALESSDARIENDESGKRRIAEGRVPIALLPPGEYIARAVVTADGRPIARVVRPFTVLKTAATSVTTRSTTGSRAPARAAVASDLPPFDRRNALASNVVNFFLDRMNTDPAAAPGRNVESAVAHIRQGRFEEAGKAVGGEPEGALTADFVRGLSLFAKGDLEAAAAAFRRSLRASPDFFPAIFYLGACYAAGGKDKEAAGAWQTSLVTETEAPFVYTMLADALLRLRDGSQALDIAREAAGIWPQNEDVQIRLVAAAAMAGEWSEALTALEPHLQRRPDDVDRLFFAMRIIYEAHAAGRSIETKDKDLARFDRYRTAYVGARGPRGELVDEWRKFLGGR